MDTDTSEVAQPCVFNWKAKKQLVHMQANDHQRVHHLFHALSVRLLLTGFPMSVQNKLREIRKENEKIDARSVSE